MKITNTVFILLFLFLAILQLSDPNPLLWFSIYLSGDILCSLPFFKKGFPVIYWVALIFNTGYAVFLLFISDEVFTWYSDYGAENIAQTMMAEKPRIENIREFYGLIILAFAIGINLLMHKRKTNEHQLWVNFDEPKYASSS